MATSQRQAMWFRCRRCAYLDIGEYDRDGQWYTKFPPCRTCGPERGRVDVVDADIELDRDGRKMLPYFASPFLTSRFGKGTERIHFENPRHLWELSRDGPITNAIFRCRRCGSEKRGTYSGQWKSEFPLCSGQYCGDGGMVDCLEWHGADLQFVPPHDCLFLSSRFGPGTEVLPVATGWRRSVLEMRLNREEWRRDRSRSPRQERLQCPSTRAYRDDQRHAGAREASHHHLHGAREDTAQIATRDVSYRRQYGIHGDYARSTQFNTPGPHGHGRYSDQLDFTTLSARPAFDHSNVQGSSGLSRTPWYPPQGGYEDRSRSAHTPASWVAVDSRSGVQSGPQDSRGTHFGHRSDVQNSNWPPHSPSYSVNTLLPSRPSARRHVRSRNLHTKKWDPTRGRKSTVRIDARREEEHGNPSAKSDPGSYCLLCHMMGHQASDCEGPAPVDRDEGIRRWVPHGFIHSYQRSSDRPTSARQLITLIATCEVVPSEKMLCVEGRDSLLLELHDEMCNYPREVDHATWIRFMSEINSIVDKCLAGLRVLPRAAVRDSFSGHYLKDESLSALVARVFAENGDFIISQTVAETAKRILDKVRILFENSKQSCVDRLQRYLKESPVYRALDEADKEWMLRAYNALVDLQPVFEDGTSYIRPLVLANIDEVVAQLGLWSRDFEEYDEVSMDATEARPQEPLRQEEEEAKVDRGLAHAGIPNSGDIKVEEDMYADVHIKAEPL